MRLLMLAVSSIGLWSSASATAPIAGEKIGTEVYQRCLDQHDDQRGIEDCQQQEIERADARLGQTYQQALKRLNPRDKSELRESERGWIKLRDSTCALIAQPFANGTIHLSVFNECRIEQTYRRLDDLNSFVTNFDEM